MDILKQGNTLNTTELIYDNESWPSIWRPLSWRPVQSHRRTPLPTVLQTAGLRLQAKDYSRIWVFALNCPFDSLQ
jgi:hypothetical protein